MAGLHQGGGDGKVGDGRPLNGGVLPAGALHADGPGGDYHVAALDRQINSAAGAHPDKGMGPNISQFLHGNCGGGPPDAGGDHAHLLPQEESGPSDILPIGTHMDWTVEMLGDGLAPTWIAGENAVASHFPLSALDVKLFLSRLLIHNGGPLHNLLIVYHRGGPLSRRRFDTACFFGFVLYSLPAG